MTPGVAQRRIVSVLFCDLVGFTRLGESLDPEDVQAVQRHYFALARDTLELYGGIVEKFIGDAVMAVFGLPRTRDDDAERAVRAGLALIGGIHTVAAEKGLEAGSLRLRVGINTGEVFYTQSGSAPGLITGDTVNVAARLQAKAEPDWVVVGASTALACDASFVFEDLGSLELKGKSGGVRAYRVAATRPEEDRDEAIGRLRAPMLGRQNELDLLRGAVDQLHRDHSERWVIVAPPGVGKTRLVEELRLTEKSIGVRIRLRSDGGPYEPVARLLATALGTEAMRDPGAARERLRAAGLTGAHGDHVLQESVRLLWPPDPDGGMPSLVASDRDTRFQAWLDALDALAVGSHLWILEDVHLATADLLAFLALAGSRPAPGGRIVVTTARPSILESAPAWCIAPEAEGRLLHLPPLASSDAEALVRALVGDALPPDSVAAIAAHSDGNPLFVEELLRTWIAVGTLVSDSDGGWRLTRPPEDLRLPGTVQTLYEAQLDDLPEPAQSLARRASVIGRRFPVTLLSALALERADEGLDILHRRALIHGPELDPLLGQSYSFRHALLRDAGYASLARADRARLHADVASALEQTADMRPVDLAPTVADQYARALENAPALANEIAGLDRAEVARRAMTWFERAGSAAVAAAAFDAGASLYERALELTPESSLPDRSRLHRGAGKARHCAGALHDAMEAFRSAAEASRWMRDAEGFADAALGYEDALAASRSEREPYGISVLEDALWVLPSRESPLRVRVLAALARTLAYTGAVARGAEVAAEAVAMARRIGDPAVLAYALLAQRIAHPGPEQLETRARITTEMVSAAAEADDPVTHLEGIRLHLIDLLELGDVAGADARIREASTSIERLSQPLYFWYPAMWAAMRALFDGRYEEAEQMIESFRSEGLRWRYADAMHVYAAQLFLLRRDQGRAEEVRPLMEDLATRTKRLSVTWEVLLLTLDVASERIDAARARFSSLAARSFQVLPTDLTLSVNLALLSEAVSVLREQHAARILADMLAPWRSQTVVLGSGALWLGSAAYFLGLAQDVAGRRDEAVATLEQAVRMNERMGARPWLVRSQQALADVLETRDARATEQLRKSATGAAGSIGLASRGSDQH